VAETEVSVRWRGEGLRFAGTAAGGTVAFASGDDPQGSGATPMQTVLLALGACTGMDVVSILTKMRQPVEDLRVEVRGDKRDEHPRVYEAIEVVYHLRGALDEAKVRRAIELSETRYCPVEGMLRPSVAIRSRFVIEPPAAS
jgi:putative redox protein